MGTRVLVQQPKADSRVALAASAARRREGFEQNYRAMPDTAAIPASFNRPAIETPRFSYSFGQLPLHPTARARTYSELRFTNPDGALEMEADRISQQLAVERPSRKHDSPRARSVTSIDSGQGAVPPIIHQATRSPGHPLDPSVRGFMELRFRHDFSKVRIHADPLSAASARTIDADAYTVGPDIVFNSGRYSPHTEHGKRLLAHELAHVVQQSSDVPSLVARQPAQKPTGADEVIYELAHATQQGQPASPQPAICSALDLTALQLPRKSASGAEFFE